MTLILREAIDRLPQREQLGRHRLDRTFRRLRDGERPRPGTELIRDDVACDAEQPRSERSSDVPIRGDPCPGSNEHLGNSVFVRLAEA